MAETKKESAVVKYNKAVDAALKALDDVCKERPNERLILRRVGGPAKQEFDKVKFTGPRTALTVRAGTIPVSGPMGTGFFYKIAAPSGDVE
jgi:hypothetical protein